MKRKLALAAALIVALLAIARTNDHVAAIQGCSGPPVITLSGETEAQYRNNNVCDNTLVDATAWSSIAVGPSPNPDGPAGCCTTPTAVRINDRSTTGSDGTGKNVVWLGGVIKGFIPQSYTWEAAHSFGGAGIRMGGAGPVEWRRVRIHNVEDGVKPLEYPLPLFSQQGSWLLRDSYMTAIRDDAIENDHFQPGTVENCLFDGVHSFISEQHQTGGAVHQMGPAESTNIYIRKVYVRLYPTNSPSNPNPPDNYKPGGGLWFKWHEDGGATPAHHNLRVSDSVFAIGTEPRRGWSNLEIPPEVIWEGNNNFILWLGDNDADYQGPRPSGVNYLYGQAARDKWVAVRDQWLTEHGLPDQGFPANYNPHMAPTDQIPVAASPTILSFKPVADATLNAESPDTNFGSTTKLEIDASTSGLEDRKFLLKFTVDGFGPRVIQSAKLELYCVNNSSIKGGDFYKVNDTSWGEAIVTWNNAPPPSGAAVASLGEVNSGNWYEVDISPLITGDGAISIMVLTDLPDGADYRSREYASREPKLKITLP
jgi:hypothetical protein